MENTIAVVGNIIIAAIGVLVAYLTARKYGDVAGTQAAIAHDEKKSKQARVFALKALWNPYLLIVNIATVNRTRADEEYATTGFIKMPVDVFEHSLFSQESPLLVGGASSIKKPDFLPDGPVSNALVNDVQWLTEQPLASIMYYLIDAREVNELIDLQRKTTGMSTVDYQLLNQTEPIRIICKRIVTNLEPLKKYLRIELRGIIPDVDLG